MAVAQFLLGWQRAPKTAVEWVMTFLVVVVVACIGLEVMFVITGTLSALIWIPIQVGCWWLVRNNLVKLQRSQMRYEDWERQYEARMKEMGLRR